MDDANAADESVQKRLDGNNSKEQSAKNNANCKKVVAVDTPDYGRYSIQLFPPIATVDNKKKWHSEKSHVRNFKKNRQKSTKSSSNRKSIKDRLRPFLRIDSYKGMLAKPANRFLRWNLLFTFFIIFMLTSPLWLATIPVVRNFSMEIVVCVVIVFNALWLVAIFNAFRLLHRLRRYRGHLAETAINTVANNIEEGIKIKHICCICFYKEPIELIEQTVASLAAVPNANKKLTICLGMEAGTPDKEEKQRRLLKGFDGRFEHLLVTIHPRGLPGDIPGKCSNHNYSSRKVITYLEHISDYGLTNGKTVVLFTTGDSDTVFPPKYFDALEADYLQLQPNERDYTVWQSPLFYCMNFDKSSFFVRVTGLMRTVFMMGYLIPWSINTMSIFSLSLNLYKAGQYTHPGYQMDDIIALIRWMLTVKRQCRIRALPVATLSGPTSGTSYFNELYEWARQIRRWTIGAAEVFHYFAIKARQLPPRVSLMFAINFLFYYGVLLCIAPLYGLIAPLIVSFMTHMQHVPTHGPIIDDQATFTYVMLGFLGLQYFWFVCVFAINKLAEPIFPNNAKDNTPLYRSILHWVLSYPTMIGYCLIELAAFAEVTVRGKAVCSHSMSNKDGLVNASTMNTIDAILEYI